MRQRARSYEFALAAFGAATVHLAACSDDEPAGGKQPPAASATTACGLVPRTYRGIDGRLLDRDRDEAPAVNNVLRLKPYTALLGDYRRIFGRPPSAAIDAASTFGVVPARWYSEPQAGAVSLHTAHRIAFAGCLSLMPSHEAWAAMPTRESAATQCAEWGLEFWGHRPDREQNKTCVSFLTNDAQFANATPPVTAPGERWAAGCAMMLTTAEFLSY